MSNVAQNVNDSNLTTRWSHTMPTWIQMDVGFITRISFVKIGWYNATTFKYNFNVQISSTGADNSFTTVATGQSTTSTALQTVNFTDTNGRYVRVNVLSATAAATPVKQTNIMTYSGGYNLNRYNPEIINIYWGTSWSSGAHLTRRNNLNTAIDQICSSDHYKILWQYPGAGGGGIKTPFRSTTHGNVHRNTNPPSQVWTPQAESILNTMIDAGTIPDPVNFAEPVDFGKIDFKHIYCLHVQEGSTLCNPSVPSQCAGGFAIPWIRPGTNVYTEYFVIPYGTSGSSPWSVLQMNEQGWAHECTHCLEGASLGAWSSSQHPLPNGIECGKRLRTLLNTSAGGEPVLTESMWSDMDGTCVAAGSGDAWTREPASTTLAGITELEVYGQAQVSPTPPPPPTIPPPGPGPSPPPAPPAPSPPAGSLDTDGVAILYQKNMNPGMFHKNIKDLNISGSTWQSSTFFEHDCEGDRGTKITEGNFVYWHMISREGSFASGGSNWTARPEWVSTRTATQAGVSGARQRGYLAEPNDPKNVEMTAIVRINNIVNERPSQHDLSMKTKGNNHVDDNEKTLQIMGKILYNDVSRHTEYYGVEITHPSVREEPVTFVSPFTATNHPQIPEGVWIGLKLVCYNVNNNSGIHMEYWVDTDPLVMSGSTPTGAFKNNWKKVWVKEEARSDTPIWGGPRSQLRIDMCEDLYMAAYSLHEIIPTLGTSGSSAPSPSPAPSPPSPTPTPPPSPPTPPPPSEQEDYESQDYILGDYLGGDVPYSGSEDFNEEDFVDSDFV